MSPSPAVLCIDDNVLGLAIRKAILESRDFRVFTAENGPAGLDIANRESIDLVVLDYHMPGMDGGTVARELRNKHPKIPILLFSGFLGQVPESVIATVDGCVSKGSPPDALIKEVQRLTAPNGAKHEADSPANGSGRTSAPPRSHGRPSSRRLLKRCHQKGKS